jgi:hypothetical protein
MIAMRYDGAGERVYDELMKSVTSEKEPDFGGARAAEKRARVMGK